MDMIRDELVKVIDRGELAKLTMDLIRIPSYYGAGNTETLVAEHVCEILKKEGICSWIEEVQDGRSNVYGLLKGSGGGKTLMLNGHIDTVPPYDMKDALIPRLEGNRLYGRGASDMKGSVAAMVMASVALKRCGVKLRGDVLLAGVIDEERQSLGTIKLLESGLKADAAIVGEPTEGRVCIAHRGLEWYEFLFVGKTVHGGRQDSGVNAISKAAKFIRTVEEQLSPALKTRTHPILEHATVNIGVIRGGTQLSTVAGECMLQLDRRFLPSERYEDAERELRDILDELGKEDPDFNCNMKVVDESVMQKGYVHMPLEIAADHPFVNLVQGQRASAYGFPAELGAFPAWTDAGLLSTYGGIPTVVFGPGYIECCHSKDEYTDTEQLSNACLAYALCAREFCR
jgi:acetylornithine deacetylase/succinyl-diaminopimelate desuccinylase